MEICVEAELFFRCSILFWFLALRLLLLLNIHGKFHWRCKGVKHTSSGKCKPTIFRTNFKTHTHLPFNKTLCESFKCKINSKWNFSARSPPTIPCNGMAWAWHCKWLSMNQLNVEKYKHTLLEECYWEKGAHNPAVFWLSPWNSAFEIWMYSVLFCCTLLW